MAKRMREDPLAEENDPSVTKNQQEGDEKAADISLHVYGPSFETMDELAASSKLVQKSTGRENMKIEFARCSEDFVRVYGTAHEAGVHAISQIGAKKIKKNIIHEVMSLEIPALNNMPGPHIYDFSKNMKAESIYSMLSSVGDSEAAVKCRIYFTDGEDYNVYPVFVGDIAGTIVPPRGSYGPEWYKIFKPLKSDLTWAEMTADERADHSPRTSALAFLYYKFENKA